MTKKIAHEGIVTASNGQQVQVQIVQTSACSGCKVAAHCRSNMSADSSESKVKVVDALCSDGSRLAVGQQVTVTAEASMAGKALLLGFGLPLLLMLVVLVAALLACCNEGMAALLMIGSLVPYYICIALMRHRIAQTIVFTIEM